MSKPRFSIIIPHYQGSISHDIFLRGINSVLNQTCTDYEVVCLHDGPLLKEEEFPVKVTCTNTRYQDWGHSLRDWGIKKASGDYLIFMNPDNVLEPNALEVLSNYDDDIIVFGLEMVGMEEKIMPDGSYRRWYSTPRNEAKSVVLTGNPVAYGNIDCMQLVMKRDKWISFGGWSDKREQSDYFLYSNLDKKYNFKYIADTLGKHY